MSTQSMRNNLTKATRNEVKNADKACFYLKQLHKETGQSEQFILASIVIEGVEKLPKYKKHKQQLQERWEDHVNTVTEK